MLPFILKKNPPGYPFVPQVLRKQLSIEFPIWLCWKSNLTFLMDLGSNSIPQSEYVHNQMRIHFISKNSEKASVGFAIDLSLEVSSKGKLKVDYSQNKACLQWREIRFSFFSDENLMFIISKSFWLLRNVGSSFSLK